MALIQNGDAKIQENLNTHGQTLVCLNKKQILTATVLKNIQQKDLPFYRLIQQPSMILNPFHPVVDLIKVDGEKMLPEMSLVTCTTHGRHDTQTGDEAPIMAIPISNYIASQSSEYESSSNKKIRIDTCEVGRSLALTLSFSERKENWYIRPKTRSNRNKVDFFYVHHRTDIQFRSLVKTYDFIVHGRLPPPTRSKNKENLEKKDKSSTSRGLKGNKLLNKTAVGYYDSNTKQAFRFQDPPLQSDPTNSNTIPTKPGDKKRKRKEEMQIECKEEHVFEDEINGHIIYILYDFEPKM